MLPIAAAGNSGINRKAYPAGYATVVSVAAIDADEVVAGFSQKNQDVELSAPGVGVLSSVPWLDRTDPHRRRDHLVRRPRGRRAARPRASPARWWTAASACAGTRSGVWTGKVVPVPARHELLRREDRDRAARRRRGGGHLQQRASDPCGLFAPASSAASPATIPAIGLTCADGAAAVAQAGLERPVVSHIDYPGSGYEAWDGTSMATPHVSAVAALIWSCHPSQTAAQIRSALTSTARDLGAPGRDNAYGFGVVQAKAALDYAIAQPVITASS